MMNHIGRELIYRNSQRMFSHRPTVSYKKNKNAIVKRQRPTILGNGVQVDVRNGFVSSSPTEMDRSGSASNSSTLNNGKLSEPRDLYSTASLLHAPKWPVECEVITEKIRHLDTSPSKPEPFYVHTNEEPQPKPVGEEMGTVIYDYKPKLSVEYFCRSAVGGSEDLQIFDVDNHTLKFESRFESGNLAKAIKVTNVYYELYLRPDMYTDRATTQWFYFRIQNTKENVQYRLSIVNMSKPDSLYKNGLKPLIYSEKSAQLNKTGWIRTGHNISYHKNDVTADENNSFYTLTFNLRFRYNNDTVYLAQCYPYTYTQLITYLKELENDSFKSQLLTVRLLCRSLAGNSVYVLTITSPDNYLESNENVKKPVVVLSARVHPGETQSSYLIKGIIDFLTSDSSHAHELRNRFIFKIIPMLNPDGVIVGNSRCCLLGQDLNRQYRTVLREAFPQIYHTKVMMRRLAEENGIFLYCDIHGHSRRNNVFMYGCENKRVPEKNLIEQIFPLMMHKNAADKFSFQSCKFKIQRNKEGTGRVFAWTLNIVNSYTLEISLCGSTLASQKVHKGVASRQFTHFNISDYDSIARNLCETLLDFSEETPAMERLRDKILQKLIERGSTSEEPINIPVTDYSSLSHSETDNESDNDENNEKSELMPISNNNNAKLNRQKSLHGVRKKLAKVETTNNSSRVSLRVSKAFVEVINVVEEEAEEIEKHQQRDQGTSTNIDESNIYPYSDKSARFRRRYRRTNTTAITRGSFRYVKESPPPKCTSLLFDDPYNPPGVPSNKIPDDNESGHSNTEDECDASDRNNTQTAKSLELMEQFAKLKLSSTTKLRNSEETARKSKAPQMFPKLKQNTAAGLEKRHSSKHFKKSNETIRKKNSSITQSSAYTAYQRRVSWTPLSNSKGTEATSVTSIINKQDITTSTTVVTQSRRLRKSKSLGDTSEATLKTEQPTATTSTMTSIKKRKVKKTKSKSSSK